MADNLPATEDQILQAFYAGSPMQQMFGLVFDRLGGIDFVQEWAEDNPSDFMRLFMAANPAATPQAHAAGGVTININPDLAAPPIEVVAEISD